MYHFVSFASHTVPVPAAPADGKWPQQIMSCRPATAGALGRHELVIHPLCLSDGGPESTMRLRLVLLHPTVRRRSVHWHSVFRVRDVTVVVLLP